MHANTSVHFLLVGCMESDQQIIDQLLNAELEIDWLKEFGLSAEKLKEANEQLLEIVRTGEEKNVVAAAKALHENTSKMVSIRLRCATHAMHVAKYLAMSGRPADGQKSLPSGPEPQAPEDVLDGLVITAK